MNLDVFLDLQPLPVDFSEDRKMVRGEFAVAGSSVYPSADDVPGFGNPNPVNSGPWDFGDLEAIEGPFRPASVRGMNPQAIPNKI